MKYNWEEIKFGAEEALLDKNIQPDAFVQTASYTAFEKPVCNLLVGRKGAGKTAFVLRLRERYKKAGHLTVDLFSDNPGQQDAFIMTLGEYAGQQPEYTNSRLSFFWEALVLSSVAAVLVTSGKYSQSADLKIAVENLTNDEHESLFSSILGEIDRARIEGQVAGSRAAIIGAFNAAVSAKRYSKGSDALKRFLTDECTEDVLVMIDNLDRGFLQEEPLKFSLQKEKVIAICKGLYDSLIALCIERYAPRLHVKACLPTDIYRRFKPRESDKFDVAHVAEILWRPSELESFFDKRISGAFNLALPKRGNVWGNVLPKTISSYFLNLEAPNGYFVRQRNTFAVISEYTFGRPRDFIGIFRTALNQAETDQAEEIDESSVVKAIRVWCKTSFSARMNESFFTNPRIEDIMRVFMNQGQRHSYGEFRHKLSVKALFLGEKDIERTEQDLYELGIVGYGIRKIITSGDDTNYTNYNVFFSHYNNSTLALGVLHEAHSIFIHPSFIEPCALDNNLPGDVLEPKAES